MDWAKIVFVVQIMNNMYAAHGPVVFDATVDLLGQGMRSFVRGLTRVTLDKANTITCTMALPNTSRINTITDS